VNNNETLSDNKDKIIIHGLDEGDLIKIYDAEDNGNLLVSESVPANGKLVLCDDGSLILLSTGGSVYLTVTKCGHEHFVVEKTYPAERLVCAMPASEDVAVMLKHDTTLYRRGCRVNRRRYCINL